MSAGSRAAQGRRSDVSLLGHHVVVALAIFTSGLLMGQGSTDRTLEAERIALRDASGRVRMVLSAREGEAALMLFDSNETMRTGVGIVDGEPGLFLYDAEPGLRLHDAAQEERAALSAEAATPGLTLRAEDGKRLRLGMTRDVPGFKIRALIDVTRRCPSGR